MWLCSPQRSVLVQQLSDEEFARQLYEEECRAVRSAPAAPDSCADEEFARRLYEEECAAVRRAKAIERRDEIMARELMRQFQEEEVPPTSRPRVREDREQNRMSSAVRNRHGNESRGTAGAAGA